MESEDTDEETVCTRKRKTCRVLASGSDDDTDDEFGFARKRKTGQVIESDDDISYVEDSDEEAEIVRKRKTRQVLESDEDEEDDDSDDTVYGVIRRGNPKGKRKAYDAFESDDGSDSEDDEDDLDESDVDVDVNISDDDDPSCSNADQCPVCLMSLSGQELGTPNSCQHVFCLECILEWSKNAVTCPVDRKEFSEIIVHSTKKGPILRRIPVEKKEKVEEEWEDEPTYCEVCHQCDREDRLLLCDDCDNGYHLECLNPPLEFVPIDEWYCPDCQPQHQDEASEEEQGEANMAVGTSSSSRSRASRASVASTSSETGVTRRARTAASARGRRRSTARSRGTSRRRTTSTRGRGRSGTSSRGRTRARTTRGRRRTKSRGRKKSTSGTRDGKSTVRKVKRRRRKRRTKKSTSTKRRTKRRKVEEDSFVNPFEGPSRRGRTVTERLNESLRGSGSGGDMGRPLASCPFPSRLEPTLSFSLFGNSYSLEVTDSFEDTTADEKQERPDSDRDESSSDVLGSILDGLDTLNSRRATLSRDGRVIDESRDAKSQSCVVKEDEKMASQASDVRLPERLKDFREGNRVVVQDEKKLKALETLAASRAKSKYKTPQSSKNSQVSVKREMLTKAEENLPRAQLAATSQLSAVKARGTTSSSTHRSRVKKEMSVAAPSSKTRFRIPKKISKEVDSPSKSMDSEAPKKAEIKDNTSASTSTCVSSSASSIQIKTEQEDHRVGKKTSTATKTLPSSLLTSPRKVRAPCKSVASSSKVPVSSSSAVSRKTPHLSKEVSSVTVKKERKGESCGESRKGTDQKTDQLSSNIAIIKMLREKTSSMRAEIGWCSGQKMSPSRKVHSSATSPQEKKSNSSVDEKNEKTSSITSSSKIEEERSQRVSLLVHAVATARSRAVSSVTTSKPTDLVGKASCSSVAPMECVASLPYDRATDTYKDKNSKSTLPVKFEPHTHINQSRESTPLAQATSSLISKGSASVVHPGSNSNTGSQLVSRVSISGTDTTSLSQPGNNVTPLSRGLSHVFPSHDVTALTERVTLPLASTMSHIRSGPVPVAIVRPSPYRAPASDNSKPGGPGIVQRGTESRDENRKKGIARLQFTTQAADEVKLALKPYFLHQEITKAEYTHILKRAVDKIKESNHHIDRQRVASLVKQYVKKIKGKRKAANSVGTSKC